MMNLAKILVFLFIITISEYRLQAKKGGRKGGRDSESKDNSRGKSPVEYKPPISGQRIRLGGYGNGTFTSGNVEVFLRNKWGIVCDDDWGAVDANVACRQLGFKNGAQQFTHHSHFGVGLWTRADILMDNVDCVGNEQSIQSCNYDDDNNCVEREAAGVICQPNTGCPEDWVAGPDACYYLSNITTTQKKFAVNKCAQIGGHLVNIESEAENHFLSSVFAGIPGEPIMTGAIKKGRLWMWERVERSSSHKHYREKRSLGEKSLSRPKRASKKPTERSSTSSYESTVQVSINYFKWFPGWQPGNKNSEPNDKKRDKCLYLANSFVHPDKSQELNLGYFFWMDEVCERKKKNMRNGFRYMCERPRNATDPIRKIQHGTGRGRPTVVTNCYIDNGVSYRGTQAFTEKGTPCIRWSESRKHTPENFPDKGLEGHNFCRNPDGDVRPWCYVDNQGKFGFCPIPQCSDEQTKITTQASVLSSTNCYIDNGESYRGTHAYTEKGTPCIRWSDSRKHTPEDFPDKGLEGHNFCRNPDGDVRPWCYVDNQGKFGFCSVPQCSQHVITTQAPVLSTTSVPECPDEDFYCGRSDKCISSQWRCDYEPDCNFGEDELACDYKIDEFEVKRNKDIAEKHVKETYMGASNETCAKLCLSRETYVCRSFGFDATERKCQLSDANSKTASLPYKWKYRTNVYERISETENCDGKFSCGNGRCIDFSLVCNQKDDCGDLSDEKMDIPQCSTTSNEVSVRLADGDEQSGRVEIQYLGEWGVICDDEWDDNDAVVICNMLGYRGISAVATGLSKYGSGNGKFMLDNVKCLGIEDNIADCPHDGWKVHNCGSFEVAGVVCRAQKACASNQYTCGNSQCIEASQVCNGICDCMPNCEDENGNGEYDCKSATLEIVNGTVAGSGRVEIVRNGLRGTICDDSWDNMDATVVCKMVGYRFGKSVNGGVFGQGTGAIWLDDVECTGAESSLSNCDASNWGVSDCSHAEDAGVVCSNTPPETNTPPVDTGTITVQLFGGDTTMEGRVELIYNGEHGTICDDGWDDEDATVVCKMLGYGYGTAKVDGFYGPGSDNIGILLDDVDCTGMETSLAHCQHAGWGVHNCAHGEDAGVICYMSETDGEHIDTDDDVLLSVTCGLRPMESKLRKRREEPDIPERELEPPKFERIIGGFTAVRGMFPWQVGVRRLMDYGFYSHWCGGTILSEHWILSAAHCFTDLNKGHVVVRTGDHDNKVQDEFEQEFELEHLISHRLYSDDTFDNDVALLKIKRKDGTGIKFGDHVQPACLPEERTPYTAGKKCHVSGWGKTESGYQNLLKSARVPIISDQVCRSVYKDLTQRMVCAGYLEGGIDTCSGDSGGPLVCDINGRYTVMGATSWGAGCAQANSPGVYARITEFIPWIKSTIKQYS